MGERSRRVGQRQFAGRVAVLAQVGHPPAAATPKIDQTGGRRGRQVPAVASSKSRWRPRYQKWSR